MSGLIPSPCNSFTECCVGFVFCSPTAPTTGTNVVCITITFSFPSNLPNNLTASMNGIDSMSPTVPPNSTIQTSALAFFAAFCIPSTISRTTCGIICTV